MPKGPKGERRPADVIGAAVMVGKIATGDSVRAEQPGDAAAVGARCGQLQHLTHRRIRGRRIRNNRGDNC